MVVGCNIPWTDVDWTMILDQDVVIEWWQKPNMINTQCWLGPKAWEFIQSIRQDHKFFKDKVKGIYRNVGKEYDSSAHVAFKVLAEKYEVTEIDIYGVDSIWNGNMDSYTRNYLPGGGGKKHVEGWSNNWNNLLDKYPHIKVEYIR